MRIRGGHLRWFFLLTRLTVLGLFCLFAMWTEYLNLKAGYNNARLVELAHGPWVRWFYELSDGLFSLFGDPLEVAQRSGGLVWSSTLLGWPSTDPVAGLSVIARGGSLSPTFFLGLILPIGLALCFGRVFCSGICPASLVFYVTSRIRRFVLRWFWLPNLRLGRGVAWGVLFGGLVLAFFYGHGIWSLILPYLAMGQSLFHLIAFDNTMAAGIVTATLTAFLVLVVADLLLGDHFVCRNLCPTGRLLGGIGKLAPVRVRRDADACIESCVTCTKMCPLGADPKLDRLVDCSLCGECVSACPSQCLTVGRRAS